MVDIPRMSHRERVVAALNHREPDLVPVDLASTRNTGILLAPYAALEAELKLGGERERSATHGISKVLGLATPAEDVLERLDIDFRGIFMGRADDTPERLWAGELEDEWFHQDDFGVIRRCPPGGHYFDVVSSPLSGEITAHDIARYPWPDPTDPGITRGLREKARHLRETTDYAIVLHFSDIFVHTTQYLRGFEPWYMDVVLDPGLAGSLMDAVLEIRMEIARRALAEVGDLVDVVSTADDVADQRGPQMSLRHYRALIKPRHARYLAQIREQTDATLLYHSCGSVVDLLPDFIDMGIQAINPVQVTARGMDPAELKAAYGRDLVFWGGIDTMHTLPHGTPEEVRAEVRRRVRELGEGGGYVVTAVHNIQPDVPGENVVAMYEEARGVGRMRDS